MNPVDHPHGEAKAAPHGAAPVSPWGVQSKGFDATQQAHASHDRARPAPRGMKG
jgi:ribosomal protein L2